MSEPLRCLSDGGNKIDTRLFFFFFFFDLSSEDEDSVDEHSVDEEDDDGDEEEGVEEELSESSESSEEEEGEEEEEVFFSFESLRFFFFELFFFLEDFFFFELFSFDLRSGVASTFESLSEVVLPNICVFSITSSRSLEGLGNGMPAGEKEGERGGGIEVTVEEEFSGSVGTFSGEGTANCIERSGETPLSELCADSTGAPAFLEPSEGTTGLSY